MTFRDALRAMLVPVGDDLHDLHHDIEFGFAEDDADEEGRQAYLRGVDGLLEDPTWAALAALVDAVSAWREAYGSRWEAMMRAEDQDPRVEADATLEMVRAFDKYCEALTAR